MTLSWRKVLFNIIIVKVIDILILLDNGITKKEKPLSEMVMSLDTINVMDTRPDSEEYFYKQIFCRSSYANEFDSSISAGELVFRFSMTFLKMHSVV